MPKFYVIALLLVGLSSVACFELDTSPHAGIPARHIGEPCEVDEDCGQEEYCGSVCVERGDGVFCERFEDQCVQSER